MNDHKLAAFLEKLLPFLEKRIEEAQADVDEFSSSQKFSDNSCCVYSAAVAVRGEVQTILDFVLGQVDDDQAARN